MLHETAFYRCKALPALQLQTDPLAEKSPPRLVAGRAVTRAWGTSLRFDGENRRDAILRRPIQDSVRTDY